MIDGNPERDAARVAVADRIRDLTHALMAHEQTTVQLEVFEQQLADMLPAATAGEPIVRSLGDWGENRRTQEPPGDGERFPLHLERPVSGAGNPWSIPLVVTRRGDRAVTTVTLGAALEGAPGRSHGGVVSAIYDDLAGYLLVLRQTMAFTAWIKVDYLHPTPVREPISFSVWLDRMEGRKMHIAGECTDDQDGSVLTRCEALFIVPRMVAELPESGSRAGRQ